MGRIEEAYSKDIKNSINFLWLIVVIFLPFVIYYVGYKLAKATDEHILRKKSIYLSLDKGRLSGELKESLKGFPTNSMNYFWPFLASGIVEFIVAWVYPIDLMNLYIPTPTLVMMAVNYLFLIILIDVVSKRMYVHQLVETEVNSKILGNGKNVVSFKKRSGLLFLILSIVTIGLYLYAYLFMFEREYIVHLQLDYMNLKDVE